MSVAAHYNARPRGRGRRENAIVRFVTGLFPMRGDGAFEVVRKLIFLAALILFIYFGGSVLIDFANEAIQTRKNDEYNNRLNEQIMNSLNIDPIIKEEVSKKVPEILPEFILGYNDNNDLIGHIKIGDNTKAEDDKEKYPINYPVFQTKDNDYYLDHAMDHSYSKGGAIFADYRNVFKPTGTSPNTVLYGHNITGGRYFAKLTRYYTGYDKTRYVGDDLDFYKDHPVIEFDTLYERSQWKIFAVNLFNTQKKHGEVFRYTNVFDFDSKDDFNEFILGIMDRSVLFTDVDITYGDDILTLSTCFYPFSESVDTRCVVFARKVREGENPNVDVNKAISNNQEYRFDTQANRIGTNWDGRVWDTSKLLSY